jgi:hypothetical protein
VKSCQGELAGLSEALPGVRSASQQLLKERKMLWGDRELAFWGHDLGLELSLGTGSPVHEQVKGEMIRVRQWLLPNLQALKT